MAWDCLIHVHVDGSLRHSGVAAGTTIKQAIKKALRIAEASDSDQIFLWSFSLKKWQPLSPEHKACSTPLPKGDPASTEAYFYVQRRASLPVPVDIPIREFDNREFKLQQLMGTDGLLHEHLFYPPELGKITKDDSGSPVLLIRKCYKELIALAFARRNNVVIVGESGIGKSALLVYAAFCELRENRDVYFVFKPTDGTSRTLFRLELVGMTETNDVTSLKVKILQLDTMVLREENRSRIELVLADGVVPKFSTGSKLRFILAASLADGNRGIKDAAKFYMGPWKEEDLHAVSGTFHGLSKAGIVQRLHQYGGYPGLIFTKPASEESVHDSIAQLVPRGSYNLLPVEVLGEDGVTTTDYGNFCYDFKSTDCKRRFVEATDTACLKLLENAAGNFAELPMAAKLAAGGQFVCKRLFLDGTSGYDANILLPKRSMKLWDRKMALPEQGPEEETFYLPRKSYRGLWDGFFVQAGLIYFVFAELKLRAKPFLSFSCVKNVLRRLDIPISKVVLIVAVLPESFQTFTPKWSFGKDVVKLVLSL